MYSKCHRVPPFQRATGHVMRRDVESMGLRCRYERDTDRSGPAPRGKKAECHLYLPTNVKCIV